MRRSLVLALVLVVLAAPGCGGSSDGAASTTVVTTTTTKPEITDEQIIDNINADLRPALETAFDPADVDCILSVLEDGGTGKLDADAVVPAYEERCGVTATQVVGVITGSTLVERGASEASGSCVTAAISKRSYEEVAALGEDETNALYERCGVDIGALTPG